jgi:hypothetical protein
MGMAEKIASLRSELLKSLEHIEQFSTYYEGFRQDFPPDRVNPKNYDLVILADIISDYYTALETAFVRISKFFENNLDQERWHKNLLEKMTMEVPGIRNAVIRNQTYLLLSEILRFRHFKRYYFDFSYDRDRMNYLEKKFLDSLPLVREDLHSFLEFIGNISN